MAEQLNVLFLPHPLGPSMFKPSGEDVVAAISDRHDMHILDYDQPIAPQFDRIDVVIDHGGSAGTREMADAATGKVRLWQILGTGFDHFDLEYWQSKNLPVANCPGIFSAVALGRMCDNVHADACASISGYPNESETGRVLQTVWVGA